ncbi:MAG: hypothetical protein R3E95_09835 [Thiolinea sp.]
MRNRRDARRQHRPMATAIAYFGTVYYVNSSSYHFRLGKLEDSWVEIYRGKYGWPDRWPA